MRPLNLLNYPSLDRQRRAFHRWWSGLAGLLLGGALAWAWQQWLVLETARLQQVQSHLEEAWARRTQRDQEAGRHQTQMRWQAEQAGHLQQIVAHQKAWMALHKALQQEAETQDLRLVRLQAEAGSLELHGAMARFDAMDDARQGLSDQLAQVFALTSMAVGASDEVNFVWQATWPAAQGGLWTSPVRPRTAKP